jgi:PAB1-binding protein PBP1
MKPLVKNTILIVLVAIIFSIGGYFLYPKLNQSTEENKQDEIKTENQTPEVIEKPEIQEPVVLTPKKEESVPPVEPTLPIGTDRLL